MDWLDLFYALLAVLLVWGAKYAGKGKWNDEAFSLKQSKALQGFAAILICLHHCSQKTGAPWHEPRYIVHGLDVFVDYGYFFVGIFLFFSAFGLYKSYQTKPDYLKGFVKKRILPIVIAFYVSELIYFFVRLAMGEKMSTLQAVAYLTGAQLANVNAWYAVVIPFFYLAFWGAFLLCRKLKANDSWGIALVWLFTLGYTVAGLFIDHNDWWMKGEWWYNSIWLFPLGLTFAKHEKTVVRRIRKGYWLYLALAVAAVVCFTMQAKWATDHIGYYGETWHDRQKVLHRAICCAYQWLASFSFVSAVMLLMMKIRIGNKALYLLGGATLEIYLIHGIFVELFGYNFLDVAKSITYIKNIPLYLVVVTACSVVAVLLFRGMMTPVYRALKGKNGKKSLPETEYSAIKEETGV